MFTLGIVLGSLGELTDFQRRSESPMTSECGVNLKIEVIEGGAEAKT